MWDEVVRALQQMVRANPDAMSRVTRTPIYKRDLPVGVEGFYKPRGFGLDGTITVPKGDTIDDSTLRHESSHAVWDQGGLNNNADKLVPFVGKGARETITGSPFYQQEGITPKLLASEGLGFSVEDPKSQEFTKRVAEMLKDPVLRKALLRLQKK